MNTTTVHPGTAPLTNFTLTASEPDFPTALVQAHPPVRRLFGKGSRPLVSAMANSPGLAIVGSRQASAQGLADAHWFAKEASQAGLTIISGLAQGIDASAHAGGLEGRGSTIAVLGHGRDSIYPAHHQGLANQIVDAGGALVTEYPDGMPALPHHFPNRNRIIAALARAVLVVEASPQSGSLITARHALELGIDVYVVPGSIHLPQSLGSNYLIRQGAQLTQSPEQLLSDLGLLAPEGRPSRQMQPAKPLGPKTSKDSRGDIGRNPRRGDPSQGGLTPDLDGQCRQILQALSFQPVAVADLEKACGARPGDLYGSLLVLELCGLARRLSDGRWLKYVSK